MITTITTRHSIVPQRARFFVLLFTLFLSACTTVTLIAPYDEALDVGITELQKSTETFLIQLEHTGRPPGPTLTKEEQDFLDKTSVAITSLQIRADAHPKNEITAQQLAILKDSFSTLGELLKAGAPKDQIQLIRNAFNASTGAILKLELAKKRGEK